MDIYGYHTQIYNMLTLKHPVKSHYEIPFLDPCEIPQIYQATDRAVPALSTSSGSISFRTACHRVKGKQMQENYWVIVIGYTFFSPGCSWHFWFFFREIQQNLQGVPETPWASDPLTWLRFVQKIFVTEKPWFSPFDIWEFAHWPLLTSGYPIFSAGHAPQDTGASTFGMGPLSLRAGKPNARPRRLKLSSEFALWSSKVDQHGGKF